MSTAEDTQEQQEQQQEQQQQQQQQESVPESETTTTLAASEVPSTTAPEATTAAPADNASLSEDAAASRKRSLSENSVQTDSAAAADAANKKPKAAHEDGQEAQSDAARDTQAVPPKTASSIYGALPEVKMIIKVPHAKVAQVIGTRGGVVAEVQTQSGAKVHINQNFPPGVDREVECVGNEEQVKKAIDMIRTIVEQGPQSILVNGVPTGGTSTTFDCDVSHVGKIIGGNGATIRDIQNRSGARVQIDQDVPAESPRKITVTGSPAAVNMAVQMIQTIMAGGHYAPAGASMGAGMGMGMGMGMGAGMGMGMYMGGAATAAPSLYGPGPAAGAMGGAETPQQVMEVPKISVGRLIGKGGETVKMIQNRSGAHVNINQQVPEGQPCRVVIEGNQHQIVIAAHLIQELLMGVHTSKVGANLPPALGAAGGMGAGGYGAGAYGAGAGMAGQQAYGAYGGYGAQTMGQPGAAASQYQYQQQQQPYSLASAAVAAGGYQQSYGAAAGAAYSQYGASSYAPVGAGAMGAVAGANTLPPEWSEHKTAEGVAYWYNSKTGVSQWERPKTK